MGPGGSFHSAWARWGEWLLGQRPRPSFPFRISSLQLADESVFGAVVASWRSGIWSRSQLKGGADAPTQPNQLPPAAFGAGGDQTHPNPPNILTSAGLSRLARQTRQLAFSNAPPPHPPRQARSSDRLSRGPGWASGWDLSSLAPRTRTLWG